jgi:RecJ-like exonuclease
VNRPFNPNAAVPCGTAGVVTPSPVAAPATYTYEHVGLDDYVSRACPDCEGVGEVDVLALDATCSVIEGCSRCNGTGEVAAYCQCGEPVSGGAPDGDNGVCHSCELVFHRDEPLTEIEHLGPGRIAA